MEKQGKMMKKREKKHAKKLKNTWENVGKLGVSRRFGCVFGQGEYKLRIPEVQNGHAGPDWQPLSRRC